MVYTTLTIGHGISYSWRLGPDAIDYHYQFYKELYQTLLPNPNINDDARNQPSNASKKRIRVAIKESRRVEHVVKRSIPISTKKAVAISISENHSELSDLNMKVRRDTVEWTHHPSVSDYATDLSTS